jgi:hypothetical protein
LKGLFEDLNLINVTKEIDKNIDNVVIPKAFVSNIIEVKSLVDKNILSDHQEVFASI